MSWLEKVGNSFLYGHAHGLHYYEKQWDGMEMDKEERLEHWKRMYGEDPDHTYTESLPTSPRTPLMRKSATDPLMKLDMRHADEITFDDFCQMYGTSGAEEGELRAVFDTIDIDKNGVIDLDEYIAFMGPQTPRSPFGTPLVGPQSGGASGGRHRSSRKKTSEHHRSPPQRLRLSRISLPFMLPFPLQQVPPLVR